MCDLVKRKSSRDWLYLVQVFAMQILEGEGAACRDGYSQSVKAYLHRMAVIILVMQG